MSTHGAKPDPAKLDPADPDPPRYLVDSNVIVRFLLANPTDRPTSHLERSRRLFESAEHGHCRLLIPHWVIAEVVYVLDGVYRIPRTRIADALLTLSTAPGVDIPDTATLQDALTRYAGKKVDFADALLAAHADALGLQPVSFDRDLDKFPDIHRKEP